MVKCVKGQQENPKQCHATSIARHCSGFVWLKIITLYVQM